LKIGEVRTMASRGTVAKRVAIKAQQGLGFLDASPTTARAPSPASLASVYRDANNMMRNLDGLQPQEAFDELLKYLFFAEASEEAGEHVASGTDSAVAKRIRLSFAHHLKSFPGSAGRLWSEGKFRLSDAALAKLHEAFADVHLSATDFDVRSAALRQFLSPELRRGLGVFLTPDAVVRAIVAAAAPPKGKKVYDPACGAGTFLIETLRYWRAAVGSKAAASVFGSDVNARMLLLAELNLGHMQGIDFHGQVLDALDARSISREWPSPGSFDFIFTNPPFGVYVDPEMLAAGDFSTRKSGSTARIQSEVLFVEQCLRWLKPGGTLGIIVPRSVVTNDGNADARAAIDALASLRGVMTLPPETFSSTGTQTTTMVLFLKRRPVVAAVHKDSDEVSVPIVDVVNVGFDSTGRERPGSQLDRAASDLHVGMTTGAATGMVRMVTLPEARSLSQLAKMTAQRSSSKSVRKLGDIIELASTGRTPARAAYVDDRGLFVLKVGNLTGQGIDWCPRDRNFVTASPGYEKLLVASGDIVLTSSAHHPKYIAQKVDIIQFIPDFVGGRASFVGEVLRLRVRAGEADPFALLAFLRTPSTRAAIQEMIAGQTAHLRPRDLVELTIPDTLANEEIVKVLRREAEISRELNFLAERQRTLLGGVTAA
jgi:type I restriction enzyme M protein